MKQSAITGTLLTLLSLLLVSAAALFFMWQGRTAMRGEIAQLEQQKQQLGDTLWSTETELVTRTAGLATATAQVAGLEGTLSAQQEIEATLAASLAQTETELAAQAATASAWEARPPLVAFFAPQPDAQIALGQSIEVVLSASDPAGVAAINLTANGESLASYSPTDEQLVTLQKLWAPAAAGRYTLSATAINAHGRSSDPVELTLTVVDETADANAEIRAIIEANVVDIRGLEPLQPITLTLLSAADLRARVETDLSDYTPAEARDDALVLSAFDFVSPDVDLYEVYTSFFSEQILGFYDPETAEFVVVSDDDALDANEQWTHAHEFVHALQDQYYQLELLNDEGLDSEASMALRALAEGDATQVQLAYLFDGYFSPKEVNEIYAAIQSGNDSDALAYLPSVLRRSFAFPYDEGFTFVNALFSAGGFTAVDAAWQNLPRSTEHILHPDRYLAGDQPQLVTLPPLTDTLGVAWRQLDADVFGEFFLRQYLAQQLDEETVDAAATGWGGDAYTLYLRDEDEALVMVLQLRWDTPLDGGEFTAAFAAYAGALTAALPTAAGEGQCWSGDDLICLYADEEGTTIIRAPDQATVEKIVETLRLAVRDAVASTKRVASPRFAAISGCRQISILPTPLR